MLLEAWRDFEKEHGDEKSRESVQKRMPRRVKKKRKVYREDGTDAGWEEYWDYIFPDDKAAAPNLKLLQMARMWKQKQAIGDESSSSSSSESEEEEEEEEERGDTKDEGKEGATAFDDRDTDYSESSSSEED